MALLVVVLSSGISISASSKYVSIDVGLNTERQIEAEHSSALDIKFNPTGTHVDSKGNLKIRLDFYPTPESKSYSEYHIYVIDTTSAEYLAGYPGKVDKSGNPIDLKDYQAWLDGLPHIWQVNPCLCAFVTVPSSVTKESLDQYIKNTYTDTVTATIDDCMIQDNSSHLISPYMKDKVSVFSTKAEEETAKSINLEKTDLQKELDVSTVNTTLSDYKVDAKADTAIIEPIEPKSIDVGPGATDRASYEGTNYTVISLANPANETGTIDTVEIWARLNITGLRTGSFDLTSGTTYQCRDSVTIGSVTASSKQTFTGLSIDIETGDYIGEYFTGGQIEAGNDGVGQRYKSGEYIDPTDSTSYDSYTYAHSIYGTGTESASYDISNTPSSKAFGVVNPSSTYYAKGSAPSNPVADGECTFTITNNGATAIDLDMKVADFTGGAGWNIVSSAPGSNEVRITAYYSGQDPASGLVLANTDAEFYDALAASATLKWDFKFETGTFTDGTEKTANITITVVAED